MMRISLALIEKDRLFTDVSLTWGVRSSLAAVFSQCAGLTGHIASETDFRSEVSLAL